MKILMTILALNLVSVAGYAHAESSIKSIYLCSRTKENGQDISSSAANLYLNILDTNRDENEGLVKHTQFLGQFGSSEDCNTAAMQLNLNEVQKLSNVIDPEV